MRRALHALRREGRHHMFTDIIAHHFPDGGAGGMENNYNRVEQTVKA